MSEFDAARSPGPRPAEGPHAGGEILLHEERADAPVRYPGQGRAAEQFVGRTVERVPVEEPRRRSGRGVSPWLVFVLLVIIAGLMFRLGLLSGGSVFDPDAVPRPVTPRGELAPAEQTVTEIYERVSPSVVHLVGRVPEYAIDSAGRRALIGERQVSGSGFIWNADGHVVTNAHVVADAEDLKVTLADGSTYSARPVGALPGRDIAVIKMINAPPVALVPIPIGESGNLRVGQAAFAIGSPFGLDQTLTTGVVSGLDRAIPSGSTNAEAAAVGPQRITGAIQTDAAINVGNSGGPLLDSAGRLIGMNTAIFTDNGGRSGGIGFAVPVDDLNRFVPELIRTGKVRPVGIGIGFVDDARMRRNLRRGLIPVPGAEVSFLLPGGAAERAGLLAPREEGNRRLPGDVIIAVDGQQIGSGSDLKDILTRRNAGETVELTIVRAGEPEPLTLDVTLQELPELEVP
ncbi:S1C family serine protease [Alienimonas sp. DA493]|uniref:S1C family serine protease n=1 Tax=Alienimonas sp. DA493 TaxID=3373605 RepID=UPI0037540199